MMPFDGKYHNLQMTPAHYCSCYYCVGEIFITYFTFKSRLRSRSNIASDLRPISLVQTIAKLLESKYEAIEPHIDRYQFGSIKGKSTTQSLADIVHNWSQAMDNKQPVRILFIDFEKVFDRVSHNLVIDKFKSVNVDPILIQWLCSFLINRRQRTNISTLITEWLILNGVMPQGSWLGPLCFVSLINDLYPTGLAHKFVDDTTLSEIIVVKNSLICKSVSILSVNGPNST